MWFKLISLTVVILWVANNLVSLARNYLIARRSGLPYRVTPINPDNIVWLLSQEIIRVYAQNSLPETLFRIIQPICYGWEYRDKYQFHQRVGSTFLVVTPGDIECWISDPLVAQIVLTRRKDFISMPKSDEVIGFNGPNLLNVRFSICQSPDFSERHFNSLFLIVNCYNY
jgi:hypothetical protein